MIRKHLPITLVAFVLLMPALMIGAENLILNPRLNYHRNNHQGPLITGDDMLGTVKPGVVNYIIFYAEFCYNAKRQARTTVNLYHDYHNRVHFVVIDFEYGWSAAQNKLVQKYFVNDIPQIVILDRTGRPVFNYIGQTPQPLLEKWLDAALEYPSVLAEANRPMDTPREQNDASVTPFTPVVKVFKKI